MPRRVPLLMTASLVALALAGCSGGGGAAESTDTDSGEITGEVSLQTWALTPKFQDYLDEVIAGFEKANPGTKVALLDQPGDGYAEKVLTQAASETLPDVVNLPPDFALPLVAQKLLVDVGAVDPTMEETYVSGALTAYQFNGEEGTFGYPWYLNTDVNYWNAEMFDSCGLDSKNPPATTDELFTQAKTLHDACPTDFLMSRKPNLGDFTLAGIPVLSDDGTEFVFNTPKAAALIDRYRDAFAAGYLPPSVLGNDYIGNFKLFTQGKVAWTTGGATGISTLETDNPSLKDKVVPTAALDISPLYVQGLSVSSESKNQPTAIALAKWVTNAENQAKFAHIVNVFPSTLESAEDPFFAEGDDTPSGQAKTIAFTSLATAQVLQPYAVNGAMNDYADQQIALAIRGDVTSKEALDQAVEKLNSMLARH